MLKYLKGYGLDGWEAEGSAHKPRGLLLPPHPVTAVHQPHDAHFTPDTTNTTKLLLFLSFCSSSSILASYTSPVLLALVLFLDRLGQQGSSFPFQPSFPFSSWADQMLSQLLSITSVGLSSP